MGLIIEESRVWNVKAFSSWPCNDYHDEQEAQVDIGAGWTACRQQNGDVYWYHHAGRSMSRSRPTEPDLSLIGLVDFSFHLGGLDFARVVDILLFILGSELILG